MSSINPKTSFPSAQFAGHGAGALTNTAASVAIGLPVTIGGQKPTYVRVSCFSLTGGANAPVAAAHVFLAPTASSATATTGDTICYGTESLWLNTLGMNAIGALGVVGNVRVQISPLEEGVMTPPSVGTAGLG